MIGGCIKLFPYPYSYPLERPQATASSDHSLAGIEASLCGAAQSAQGRLGGAEERGGQGSGGGQEEIRRVRDWRELRERMRDNPLSSLPKDQVWEWSLGYGYGLSFVVVFLLFENVCRHLFISFHFFKPHIIQLIPFSSLVNITTYPIMMLMLTGPRPLTCSLGST